MALDKESQSIIDQIAELYRKYETDKIGKEEMETQTDILKDMLRPWKMSWTNGYGSGPSDATMVAIGISSDSEGYCIAVVYR